MFSKVLCVAALVATAASLVSAETFIYKSGCNSDCSSCNVTTNVTELCGIRGSSTSRYGQYYYSSRCGADCFTTEQYTTTDCSGTPRSADSQICGICRETQQSGSYQRLSCSGSTVSVNFYSDAQCTTETARPTGFPASLSEGTCTPLVMGSSLSYIKLSRRFSCGQVLTRVVTVPSSSNTCNDETHPTLFSYNDTIANTCSQYTIRENNTISWNIIEASGAASSCGNLGTSTSGAPAFAVVAAAVVAVVAMMF